MGPRAERITAPGGTTCCTIAELLALRAAAAAVDLAARPTRARAEPGGAAPSRQRGRGIEFEEVRAYAPGDDVRSIDWRVTARTGRPHTRVFRAERERPVYLLIDQRAQMRFGSQVRLKSVQALRAAALLAWAALGGGDRIGGLVLTDTGHHERRPRRSRHAVLELLRLGLAANMRLAAGEPPRAAPESRLEDALAALRRVARPGSLAVLISDFHDLDGGAQRQLHLLARHVEVRGLWVLDPLERELPRGGTVRATDGQRALDLPLATARVRHAEQAALRAAEVRGVFRRNGAPMHELETGADTAPALALCYARRARA
jgi:uncharacterized protein (DUF58 family)